MYNSAAGLSHTRDLPRLLCTSMGMHTSSTTVGHCFVQDNQMLQEPLGQGERPYQSLLAQIEKRPKDSKLLPAEPVKQQQLHAHPDPPPLTNNAQLSVTQQGAGVAADKVVRSDSQSRLQLDAAGSTLSAGELGLYTLHSWQGQTQHCSCCSRELHPHPQVRPVARPIWTAS